MPNHMVRPNRTPTLEDIKKQLEEQTTARSFEDVCLYVLMRTELSSMNNGKACAQSTHAANQCVYDVRKTKNLELHAMLVAWEGDRGFGTCVVLDGGPITLITNTVSSLISAGFHASMVHDESYPLRDGGTTHLIPLDTCAYVFGLKHQLEPYLKTFPLLP